MEYIFNRLVKFGCVVLFGACAFLIWLFMTPNFTVDHRGDSCGGHFMDVAITVQDAIVSIICIYSCWHTYKMPVDELYRELFVGLIEENPTKKNVRPANKYRKAR